MFIFNTQLLLIDVDSIGGFLLTFVSATVASLLFAAASQWWFLTRNKWYETLLLLIVAFSLFRPNFWMDMIYPPYRQVAATDLMQTVEKAPDGGRLRLWVEGEDANGRLIKKGLLLSLAEAGPAVKRLDTFGVRLLSMGGQTEVLSVRFRSRADKIGFRQGQKIIAMEVANERPAAEWAFIPALGVLALIVVMQRRRIAAGAPS